MKTIIFVSWKDIKNPAAGGAEAVHQELSKRFIQNGHRVIHLVPGFKDCLTNEIVDGVEIIRVGNSLFSFYQLAWYFKKFLKDQCDILIDVFNCFGSFTFLTSKKTVNIFFIHHIQAEVWKYQTTPPFVFPLNYIGWLIEKIQLLLIAKLFKGQAVTISDSTRNELLEYGFNLVNTSIIREGSDIEHLEQLENAVKNDIFTVLFVGRWVKMKRPLDAIKSFEIFHKKYPNSQMRIIGSGDLSDQIKSFIQTNGLVNNVEILTRISNEEKLHQMQKASVILVTSIKEGWGLVVTEANSQGTPCISYNVAGLRDSNTKGLVTKQNTPEAMAEELERLYLDKNLYNQIQKDSWSDSLNFTFDNCYLDFEEIIAEAPLEINKMETVEKAVMIKS